MTPDRPPMVTPAERKLLAFLTKYQAAGPVRPSYREMADALGFPSPGSAAHLITQLEKRGFIRRIPGRARSVEVVRQPGELLINPKVAAVEAMLLSPRPAGETVRAFAQRIVAAVLAP